MDPFAVIMLGGTAGLVVGLYLLGRFYPGSGAEQLDWRPTRSAEVEAQNEIDDLEGLLAAANARRRARGKPEITEEDVRASVGEHVAEQHRRRDAHLAEQEVEQMVERKNARRRAKGLPEVSVEDEKRRILEERGE